MLNKQSTSVCILGALLLTACASSPPDQAARRGIKHAWVVAAYAPDAPGAALPECLAVIPRADLAARHFVNVQYKHARHMRTTIAELPAGIQANADDEVELWLEDCTAGKIPRISRNLSAASSLSAGATSLLPESDSPRHP